MFKPGWIACSASAAAELEFTRIVLSNAPTPPRATAFRRQASRRCAARASIDPGNPAGLDPMTLESLVLTRAPIVERNTPRPRARNASAGCPLDLPTPSRQRHTAH
jgi:hypothetical protein